MRSCVGLILDSMRAAAGRAYPNHCSVSRVIRWGLPKIDQSMSWTLALANGGYAEAVAGTDNRGRSRVKTHPLPGKLRA